MPQRRSLDDRRQRGLSLVETLTAIGITAIVAGIAVPSFQQSIARQRIEGRTAELVADLAHARNEAMTRNMSVFASFQTNSHGACYVLHTGKEKDCVCTPAEQTQCQNGAIEIKTVMFPAGQDVGLLPPKSNPYVSYSHARGTASGGSIEVLVATHAELTLRTVVAPTGRVKVCAANSSALPGYKKC